MTKKEKFINFFSTLKNKITDMKYNKTILACILFCILYLISGYCKWIEILACATSLVFMFFLPLQNSLCLFMFLHSFTKSNIAYDSCFMATFVGFTLILLIKFIIGYKKGTYSLNKKIIYAIIGFYLYGLISSLFKPIFYNTLIYLTYLPLFYLVFEMRKEFNIRNGLNYMFGGLIASACLGVLIFAFPQYQYSPLWAGRFSAMFNNPNHIYIRGIFLLSFYSYLFLNEKISSFKFFIIYAICAIISLSCLSKTGIFMLALISLIVVVIYLKQNFKQRIKNVLILFAILLTTCLIGYKFVWSILKRVFDAFESENFFSVLLTNRDEIWSIYLTKIFENPISLLIGNGIFTKQLYVPSQFGPAETHNFYIWLLYRFGVLGIIILCRIIYLIIKELKPSKLTSFAYLPLMFLLIESLFDNTMKCYNITYFLFAFMILFHRLSENNETKDTKQSIIQTKN